LAARPIIVDAIRHDEAGSVATHYAIAMFEGRWVGGEAKAGDDAEAIAWVAVSALDGLAMTPGVAELIRTAHKSASV
jgi:ADP-ribose pyrophosphatase